MNKQIAISLFMLMLSICLIPETSYASSEEELQLLRLYYSSKDLVFSTTRNIKPISQVAENITIITAEDIRAMNAHTVAEVLNQVPGLFIHFNRDFGGVSNILMQGSKPYHTLVLLDGIRWNTLAERNVVTNNIPVEIIERIEIIKGPASSTWGSSLGGVVNIITKHLDGMEAPSGTVYASYGERNTSDLRASYTGVLKKARYYVYAGRQDSNGLRAGREFDNTGFYSKLKIPIYNDLNLKLSLGVTEPEQKFFEIPSFDLTSFGKIKTIFGNGVIDTHITENTQLNISFHLMQKEYSLPTFFLSSGELIREFADEERLLGGSSTLTWMGKNHTITLGVDTNYGDLDVITHNGPSFQGPGVPPTVIEKADENEWAFFINDTILINQFAFTPGIRYDHNSIYGSFVSPSIGVTFQAWENTIIRGNIARGFTAPSLVNSSIGGFFFDSNPDLDPEEVWSYQLGAESSEPKYFWIKTTLFYHKLENEFNTESQPSGNAITVNSGASERRGIELELATIPYRNFSLNTGISFVNSSSSEKNGNSNIYAYHIKINYEDKGNFNAYIFGQYLQGLWDNDEFIWDFNLRKQIISCDNSDTFLIITAHNLFNGAQYDEFFEKNPKRWLEAGIQINFH